MKKIIIGTLLAIKLISSTSAAEINFQVRPLGGGQAQWSFSSTEERPMLYLVSIKEGLEDPKDCDDGRALFAVRDILTYEEGNFTWPNPAKATVQLCVLNLFGFVEERIVYGFDLK